MADFPTTIYSPRTKANRSGVVYDAGKETVLFAEDISKLEDEVVAIETLLERQGTGTVTSHATPTINTDTVDSFSITALAVAITSMTTNLGGTPTNFQKLIIRFKDDGSARAITWGAKFEDAGYALPLTTVASTVLTVVLIYNTVTAKFGCIYSSEEETAFLEKTGGTMTGKIIKAGTTEVGKTYTPATGAQSVAIDCDVNNMHEVTGHADGTAITFTVTNATSSQPFIISILQGATTVSTITSWFATVRWVGGSAPTLTATLSKRDTFGFIRTGANTYDGFVIGQNA